MPSHLPQNPPVSLGWINSWGDYTHSITGGFGRRNITVIDSSSFLTVRTRGEEISNNRAPFTLFRGDGAPLIEPKTITLLVRGTSRAHTQAALEGTFSNLRDTGFFRMDHTEAEIQWWLQGYGLTLSNFDVVSINNSFTEYEVQAELQPIHPIPSSGYASPTPNGDFSALPMPPQPLAQYQVVTPTNTYLLTVAQSSRAVAASFGSIVQPPASLTGFPSRAGPPRVTKLFLQHVAQEVSRDNATLRPYMLLQALKNATQIRTYPELDVVAELPGNGLSVASVTTETTDSQLLNLVDIEFRVKKIPGFVFEFGLFSQGFRLHSSQGYRLVDRRR